jgi:hypothetical protein
MIGLENAQEEMTMGFLIELDHKLRIDKVVKRQSHRERLNQQLKNWNSRIMRREDQ